MTNKRVAIYARVSTKDQTAENQLIDLRAYCSARNWLIVGECVDSGLSGTKDNRPQLRAAMELAKKRKIDILLVWRFDRFARSLPHLVNSLEELRTLRVDFVSYQESVDTSSPQGRMVFGVMASLAEFERSLIVERINAGLRRAKAAGKRLGRPVKRLNEELVARLTELQRKGLSIRRIAGTVGMKKSTVALTLSKQSPLISR